LKDFKALNKSAHGTLSIESGCQLFNVQPSEEYSVLMPEHAIWQRQSQAKTVQTGMNQSGFQQILSAHRLHQYAVTGWDWTPKSML